MKPKTPKTNDPKSMLRSIALLLSLVVSSVQPLLAQADDFRDPASFRGLFELYDSVRHSLFLGSTEGVDAAASDLARQAEELEAGTELSGEVQELLPEIRSRALALAAAKDLATARSALSELTKPLVRWRKLLPEGEVDHLPVVVYCAMSEKAWLQTPDERVENPYQGQSMARCGEVVLGGEGE